MKECILIETLSHNRLSVDDEILINFNYEWNELINAILKTIKMKAKTENE